MHIADNIVPPAVWIGGFVVTGAATGFSVRTIDEKRIALVGVVTAFVFATTTLHVPLGPTSVHLLLHGLTGIVLGPLSILSSAVCVTFQAFLGHGGITTIGLNAAIAGTGAFAAWSVFALVDRVTGGRRVIAALTAVAASFAASLTAFTLVLGLAGQSWSRIAEIILIPYLVVLLVEALVTSTTIHLIAKVRPDLLRFRTVPAPSSDHVRYDDPSDAGTS